VLFIALNFLLFYCKTYYFSCCSIRPSGSESLPGSEASDPATFEDVSTCGVGDLQGLDPIPEQAPLDGEYLLHYF
jgi:hypothetical protein